MEFSFNNMCRTCMNDEGQMCSVFTMENEFHKNQSYAEMLMTCFTVQVQEGDGLPELICQQCKKQLLVAYSFKQQTERSDATLREITKNPDIEFIKEEIPEVYTELDELFHVEFNHNNEPQIPDNIRSLKPEAHDFELSAEFLNDDIIVEDGEDLDTKYSDNFELPPMKNIKILERNYVERSYINCEECGILFKTAAELRKHKKLHMDARSYACEICGRVFRSAHGLAYHLKIHKGIKNYVCNYENCDKKFTLKQALEKHLSIHSNEKNHLCSLCGKTYSTYDALHYHIKAHKGERPHLCMHCGKTFKQSCHLKSHMWVHNGIKPHVCKKCGKCYTSGHQLKKHLRKYCSNTAEPVLESSE